METTLVELCKLIATCPDCDLAQTRTKAVPGTGPQTAEVMFIGEAPGFNEDRTGEPFVGPAGKFLNDLLGYAGLRRSDVYITNIVKCRPPQNRDPLRNEIDACDKWLQQQIALINPKVIVTLGRYSMAKFFANESISRIHGRPKVVDGRLIVPMYHPAAALHQERFRSQIVDDFKKLPEFLAAAEKAKATPPAAPPAAEPEAPPAQGRLF